MERVNIAPVAAFSPQPMYVIGTKNEDDTANFSVITWLGFSWDGGPCLMMSIGGSKRTKTNILREGVFSAHMVTEELLWLADYFGCTKGERQPKTDLPYDYAWGEKVEVPVLAEARWVYECRVIRTTELDDAHLFLARIENIQMDRELADMDLRHIDLKRMQTVLYSPYQYFSAGEKLGEIGDWQRHQQK